MYVIFAANENTDRRILSEIPIYLLVMINDDGSGDLMAKHEFGILETNPESEASYDTYEPEKNNCIAVDDDSIEPLLKKLSLMETYSHRLSRPIKGLEYTGITLIPPTSLPQFKTIIASISRAELHVLSNKIDEAMQRHKFMIHYGL